MKAAAAATMPRVARGHVEQLPSGSFRAVVYAGTDPFTRRQLYFKATVKTEPQASPRNRSTAWIETALSRLARLQTLSHGW